MAGTRALIPTDINRLMEIASLYARGMNFKVEKEMEFRLGMNVGWFSELWNEMG